MAIMFVGIANLMEQKAQLFARATLQFTPPDGMILPMKVATATTSTKAKIAPISRAEKRRLAAADTRPRTGRGG